MKAVDYFPGMNHYGQGSAQVLTHAESHALMRAWKKTGGSLGSRATIYVDRATCGNCQTYLPDVARNFGLSQLTVRFKNGGSFIWPQP